MADKTMVKSKSLKKCRSCGLDCTITRGMNKDKLGDGKPKYSTETCPKR